MNKTARFLILGLMVISMFLYSCDEEAAPNIEEYPNLEIPGLTDGGSTDDRTHTIEAEVPNPGEGGFSSGRAIGDTFDGSVRVYVNDSFTQALPSYSSYTGTWTIDHDLSLVSGENEVYLATYTADGALYSESQRVTVTGTFDPAPYRIRLHWDNYGDVDLHMVKDDNWSSSADHSYYANKVLAYAALDYDNTYALGPEHITLESNASSGNYKVYVKYFDEDVDVDVVATITIFKDDVEIFNESHTFVSSDQNTGTSSYDSTRDWFAYEFDL